MQNCAIKTTGLLGKGISGITLKNLVSDAQNEEKSREDKQFYTHSLVKQYVNTTENMALDLGKGLTFALGKWALEGWQLGRYHEVVESWL